jgi:hypothetical protein
MGNIRIGRVIAVFIGAFVLTGAAAALLLSFTLSSDPVPIHIRWKPGTTDSERVELEGRFGLTKGEVTEGTTRAYRLTDTSTDNIRAMVRHPSVEDTANINRIRFRPAFAVDRERRLIFFSVLLGGVGAVALLLAPRTRVMFGLTDGSRA